MEDATQNMYQGLPAQMSLEEVRCVHGKLNMRRKMKIACADVRENVETCAERMLPEA